MKHALRMTVTLLCLSCGIAWAQSGTINALSVNPRQNIEMTNSTGTETGQPSDSVPGSQNEENGLVPVTSNMVGSGSNGNMNQPLASPTAAAATNTKAPAGQQRNQPHPATPPKSNPAK